MASIRRRDKKWVVDYCVGQTRKRHQFSNKAEAECFKRDLLLRPIDRATGFSTIKKIGLDQAVKRYKELVTALKSNGTQLLEEYYFKEFLSFFGNCLVDSIGLEDLQSYQVHLRKRCAAETVNRNFSTLKNFFNKCIDWDYLSASPALKLKCLKSDRQKAIRTYGPNEVEKMLKSCQSYLADIIFLAFHMGLRRKEIVSLRWSAVDLDAGVLHIECSDGFHPKGYRPRSLPLRQDLRDFLKSKKIEAEKRGVAKPNDRVFLNSVWNEIDPRELTREMARLGKRIGISNLGIHQLRHTFCTNGVHADLSIEKIRLLAGHADVRTTERYFHVTSKDLIESVDRVGKVIKLERGYGT